MERGVRALILSRIVRGKRAGGASPSDPPTALGAAIGLTVAALAIGTFVVLLMRQWGAG